MTARRRRKIKSLPRRAITPDGIVLSLDRSRVPCASRPLAAATFLAAALLATSCASDTPDPTPRELPGALETSEAAEEAVRNRDESRRRFFRERGLEFESWVSPSWRPLGNEFEIYLLIRNVGSQAVSFPASRTVGWWPFRSEERGRIVFELAGVGLSPRVGIHQIRKTIQSKELSDLEIYPGEETTMSFAIPDPGNDATEYLRLSIRATIYPLAVNFEGEPQRFTALQFPESVCHGVPSKVLERRPVADWTDLTRAAEQRPQDLLAWAALLCEQDRVRTVDSLMKALPGTDRQTQRRLITALRWVTRLSLGSSVDTWHSWWESEDGARWALRERRPS